MTMMSTGLRFCV